MPKVSVPVSTLRPPAPRMEAKILVPSEVPTSVSISGIPTKGYVLRWPDVGKLLPSLLVRYRLTDGNGPGRSVWSPPTEFEYSFFDIYRRKVSSPYNPGDAFTPWEKVETSYDYESSVLIADWTGSVQYAVALSHPDNAPSPAEGVTVGTVANVLVADLSTIRNSYVLYITNVLPTVVV